MLKFIGFLLPAFIDFINSKVSDSRNRFWISVLVCALVGGGVNYIEHNGIYTGLNMLMIADSLGESALMMFGMAQLSFNAVWSNDKMLGSVRDTLGLNAKTNGTE